MSNIEETKMTDEAFNELIDNFEIVGHLTEYGRKAIKQKIKEMQAKIKELEAKLEFKKYGDLDELEFEGYMSQFISKQKVKDKIEELKKEKNRRIKLGIFILKDYENQHLLGEISSLEELLEEGE